MARDPMKTYVMGHTGAELDQAITDWANTLVPVYTLPPQVMLSAVCNPTVPCVNLSWIWQDTEFGSGIIIRRKLGEIPETVNDGDLVCNIQDTVTCSFQDADFDSGDASMVGTYDSPVSWYYRAFPYNVNGQYQTNYQTSRDFGLKEAKVYYLADGSTLDTLALKDTFIFGKYAGVDLVWRVTSILENRMMVTLDYDQLFAAQFDAPEPNNTNTNRVSSGSNRWSTSNARQFLHATGAADSWFVAQTDTDVMGNNYKGKNGFLYEFTESERNLIIPEVHVCLLSDEDGGGTETVTDVVWLPCSEEMGWTGTGFEGEGTVFDIFAGDLNTNANRIEKWAVNHWTRTRVNGTTHQARFVNGSGNASAYNASNTFSLRAGLSLPLSSFITYDEEAAMFRVYAV